MCDLAVVFAAQQLMPLFGAEMRHVNHRRRVGGLQAQHLTGRQRLQPLAGLQDGQGAQQADGIKIIIMGHAPTYASHRALSMGRPLAHL